MADPWEMTWEESAKQIDEEASSRLRLDDGYYLFRYVETRTDNKDGSQDFKFVVEHGPMKGRVHWETRKNPRFCEKEEEAKTATKKAQIMASRLGAVTPETKGKASPNWTAGIGKLFVGKIENREYTNKDNKKAWACDFGFANIWPVEHADVARLKNDVRATMGLPAIAGNDPLPVAAGKAGAAPVAAAGNGNAASNATAPTAAPSASKMAMDIFG